MDKNIRYVKGVGEKMAGHLAKLDIHTVGDIIKFLPRRYDDIGTTVAVNSLMFHRGQKVSVFATVCAPLRETRVKGGTLLTQVFVSDESGMTRIVFFNNKFIKSSIREGDSFYFYGKVADKGEPILTNPQFFDKSVESDGLILPVYPLTSGLNQKFMRKVVSAALEQAELYETLPDDIIKKYGLPDYPYAINRVHFPKSEQDIARARHRLIFEELLYFTLGVRMLRNRARRTTDVVVGEIPSQFIAAHPFEPTVAQSRALGEIYSDLQSGYCMHRLLQGDVGSGKTLVAGQAAFCVIKSGAQAAMMAPTEVLANQHYRYFDKMLTPLGVRVGLLTASVSAAKKRELKKKLADGELDFVVGTHALLQKDTEFKKLGLVITDEQHRFGVMQRSALADKGTGSHILVMSATPIPRTLALMLWGDLDLSVIDSLPSGRQQISTYLVDNSFEQRLNAFIEKNIQDGGRVYVVCPMIEDNDESDISSATERYESLCARFGAERVALVHGKMKAADKDRAMTDFAEGRVDILVSTTVIEVGVNVPEATLMIIENAERFGLSQLHQLRGRVGRGDKKSYCVLVSEKESERLSYFTKTTDGFKIANKDLELRGPGNFFGRDQHGLANMQVADMQQDMRELEQASECAAALLESDPELERYPRIKAGVYALFESKGEIFN